MTVFFVLCGSLGYLFSLQDITCMFMVERQCNGSKARPLSIRWSRGRIPDWEHGMLLGVQIWLSTLEIVNLCVFRRRH